MVRLDYLDPFELYRVTPPMIAPENKGSPKKNMAYMVLAPSLESELKWLSQTKLIRFRHIYKYFIDKRWDYTLYGNGRQVIKINTDNEVSDLLNRYTSGNLGKITEVTSYLNTATVRPLRDMNVLVEANYGPSLILNNQKDRRAVNYRATEAMNEYARVAQSALSTGYLGNYTLSIFVPVDLWWTDDDLRSINTKLKLAARDVMGQFIGQLSNPNTIKRFTTGNDVVRFYFTYGEVVLILDTNGPTEPAETYLPYFKKFAVLALRAKKVERFDSELETEPLTSDKLAQAEKQTKADIVAEKIIDTAYHGKDEMLTDEGKTTIAAEASKIVENNPDVVTATTADEPEVQLDAVASDTAADVVIAAKMEGRTVASQKRNEMLKEKYKELNIGSTSLVDAIETEATHAIPDTPIVAKVVNDSLKNLQSNQLEASYNKNLATADMARILLHFSHAHPAMYLNKDIQIEDISTPSDRILKYTVEFEDENRKRHRFSFKMPKVYKDKYLYLADQQLNISHQKLPYPVTKVSPDKCQAVTNYKKIFTERYGSNISPRITKLKKIFLSPGCPRVIKVDHGDATTPNAYTLTTIEYDELGSSIVRLTMGSNQTDVTRIMFVAPDAAAIIGTANTPKLDDPKETAALFPFATRTVNKKKESFYLSGISNLVYDSTGKSYGELSEFIITAAGWYDKKFQSEFDDVSPGSKFVYSRSKVLAAYIPLILVVSAADPGGLLAVLEKAGINYEFSEKRVNVDKTTKGVIPFSDGYLIYDRYPYENSLLLNGLQTFPTKEFGFYDLQTRDAYVEIFDLMYGRRNLYDGLQTFNYMFVDPITEDVLIRLKLPTDFTRLMLYCNDILTDNSYQIDSDYHNSRIRSNEIIYAYLYTELADAWGRYKDGKAEKFSIPEDVIIKRCLTSNVVDPHTELNLTLEAENSRQVKLSGPSGMNEIHSFTLEKRAFHPSMAGIIGMNSTPSGDVGIGRHMTLNPNVIDDRGFVTVDKPEYDGTELLTPGEMMQTFGAESADVERLAMAISQSKHVVPVNDSSASLVTYDMERVMPYLSTDFAHVAKMDGKVVALENDVMIIQYADGSYDDVDLAERPARNTDGGFFVMNQMSTDLKVGSKVKAGQLVAYDHKYINGSYDMFGDPLANIGTLTRIAVETSGGVYEDSCTITSGLSQRMKTKITKQKRVILSRFANITHMVKIGDRVHVNDPILVFDDTADEFSSQMLAAMAMDAGDEDEITATSAPVVSKVSGVIRDIRIYYTIPLEEMTASMQKIVGNYVKTAQKREKTISKYMPTTDANTIVKTSEMMVPDSQGKVNGTRVNDGVIIDFYIEYEDTMAPGDKQTFFCALKGIVSDIIPEDLAPYTDFNPDRKIQAYLSGIGIYKRMSLDIIKVGMLTKILVEKKHLLANTYHDKIKAALKNAK